MVVFKNPYKLLCSNCLKLLSVESFNSLAKMLLCSILAMFTTVYKLREQMKSKVEFTHSEKAKEISDALAKEILSALLGQKTPKRALDGAAAKVKEIIKEKH